MLFSYAVRAVYVESCSMFVRGGVYRVVREALGGNLANISVSALMFDYVLTGPISGVSAGLYLAGMINETAELLHAPNIRVHPQYFAALFTILITLMLFSMAIINLVTKKTATIWGIAFTLGIYIIFLLSERANRRRAAGQRPELDKFRLVSQETLSQETISARPGNVIVAIRNPRQLDHLQRVLARTDIRKMDIVVLTVLPIIRKRIYLNTRRLSEFGYCRNMAV